LIDIFFEENPSDSDAKSNDCFSYDMKISEKISQSVRKWIKQMISVIWVPNYGGIFDRFFMAF